MRRIAMVQFDAVERDVLRRAALYVRDTGAAGGASKVHLLARQNTPFSADVIQDARGDLQMAKLRIHNQFDCVDFPSALVADGFDISALAADLWRSAADTLNAGLDLLDAALAASRAVVGAA